ncbi:olfactory receptor 51V1-like [Otolemur garnettii]|uniref:olfactory receptor 51V1-like n=1 Tax=Otolemur garnettii TaxID=30611 RepID=UPI000273F39E|nr:olfactory receptor 51V1-like [Otolemur garnettii]
MNQKLLPFHRQNSFNFNFSCTHIGGKVWNQSRHIKYIIVCNPLYTSILTSARIIKTGLGILVRSFMFIIAPIVRLKFFHYCHSRVLSHSFCLHQDLLRLACSDIRFNSFYALALVICILLSDSLLILISYILILHSVLATASREERLKTLQTCVSHISAVLVFYIPIIGLTMVHHFGKHLSPVVHVLMGNIYIIFPPLMNPIIYSVKTQQIYIVESRDGSLRNSEVNCDLENVVGCRREAPCAGQPQKYLLEPSTPPCVAADESLTLGGTRTACQSRTPHRQQRRTPPQGSGQVQKLLLELQASRRQRMAGVGSPAPGSHRSTC